MNQNFPVPTPIRMIVEAEKLKKKLENEEVVSKEDVLKILELIQVTNRFTNQIFKRI